MNISSFSDLGRLVLRLSIAVPMVAQHGWSKLMNYSTLSNTFPDPLGVGSPVSLALVIFAEVFCSLAIALGLFTRLAALPPAFAMGVAFFVATSGKPFGERELPFLLMMGFISIALIGPGSYSMDRFFRRKG